jgi:hypothetical protein
MRPNSTERTDGVLGDQADGARVGIGTRGSTRSLSFSRLQRCHLPPTGIGGGGLPTSRMASG